MLLKKRGERHYVTVSAARGASPGFMTRRLSLELSEKAIGFEKDFTFQRRTLWYIHSNCEGLFVVTEVMSGGALHLSSIDGDSTNLQILIL